MKSYIISLANKVFGDKNKAQHWLSTPNSLLDYQRPSDLINTDRYESKVKNILGRIEHGIYS
jgi:putative toxin-antitoxin system antitoxin component (TIGR02293 family)